MNALNAITIFSSLFESSSKIKLTENELAGFSELNFPDVLNKTYVSTENGQRVYECFVDCARCNTIESHYDVEEFINDTVFLIQLAKSIDLERERIDSFLSLVVSSANPLFEGSPESDLAFLSNQIMLKVLENDSFGIQSHE